MTWNIYPNLRSPLSFGNGSVKVFNSELTINITIYIKPQIKASCKMYIFQMLNNNIFRGDFVINDNEMLNYVLQMPRWAATVFLLFASN